MKLSILLVISMIFASSAMAEMPQHYTPWPTNGTIYLDEKLCPQPCYPLVENGEIKDIEILSLVDVAVDDPSKPIYGKEEIEICDSEEKCKLIVSEKKCQKLSFHPIYIDLQDGNFEAYCTGVTGYRQMLVKRLEVDPIKKAAKLMRENAAQKAEEERKAELMALKARIKTLANQNDLTAAEVKEAILKLIKAKALSGEI